MNESVAVIISVFGETKYLTQCIASVLNQTYPVSEICIVDDGSNDSSVDFELRSIIDNFNSSRITLVKHPTNLGTAQARNTGVTSTHSTYLAFLDSDDFWEPDKVQKQMDQDPKSQSIIGTSVTFNDSAGIRTFHNVLFTKSLLTTLFESLFSVAPSSLLMSRELFNKLGGFDPKLRFAEDWDFLVRAELLGFKLLIVSDFLTHMNTHQQSLSTKYFPYQDTRYLMGKMSRLMSSDSRINRSMLAQTLNAMARWMRGRHKWWFEYYLLFSAIFYSPRIIFSKEFRGNFVASLLRQPNTI